jgi:hypothetical protein
MNRKLFSTITCLVATLGFIFGAPEQYAFGNTKSIEKKDYEAGLKNAAEFDFRAKDYRVEFRDDHDQFGFKAEENKNGFIVDEDKISFKDNKNTFGFFSNGNKFELQDADDKTGFLNNREKFEFRDDKVKFDFRDNDAKIQVDENKFGFQKDDKSEFGDNYEKFDSVVDENKFSFLNHHDKFSFKDNGNKKGFLADHNKFNFKDGFNKVKFKDSQKVKIIEDIKFDVLNDLNKINRFQNQKNHTLLTKSNKDKIKTETIRNIMWQWNNNPFSILNALQAWFEDKDLALKKLKEGQANNKNGQHLYDVAAKTLPDFWNLVFYSTWSKADFSALESNLAWQWQNNWDSLSKSEKAWHTNPKQEKWAYYYLLWGQRDNPNALNLYRACWNENKEKVMSIVNKISKK